MKRGTVCPPRFTYMKSLVRSTLCALYKYSGAMSLREKIERLGGHSFVVVLLFHRVTDEIPEDALTVGTRFFRKLCLMLRNRFRVMSLAEAMDMNRQGQPFPARSVVITFDDCYHNNLWAARTLAEYGLPACFFMPSGYVDTERVFPWDAGLRSMPNLSWADVREMAALGHEIGSHTVNHVDMAKVSDDEARRELAESKRTIEEHVGQPVRWFAFPFGGKANCADEHFCPMIHELGYDACFSGHGGFIHAGSQEQVLPRQPIPTFDSLIHLELFLNGSLGWIQSLKRKVGLV
ncbi:MAG: polysaccharide deacetylase family protein [Planctomycetes bacterium]|nr:polysaccharide deacetylase family protein [Planctomycetota bacterium]